MGTSVLLSIFNLPREPVKHFLMGNAGYPAKVKSKDLTSQRLHRTLHLLD